MRKIFVLIAILALFGLSTVSFATAVDLISDISTPVNCSNLSWSYTEYNMSSGTHWEGNTTGVGACWRINSSHITLDCAGNNLTGNSTLEPEGHGATVYGIIVNDTFNSDRSTPLTNITIMNCIVKNYTVGILLNNSNGSITLQNVTVANNTNIGVLVNNSHNVTLTSVTAEGEASLSVTNNETFGFAFNKSIDNVVTSCYSYNNSYGFYLNGSNRTNITSSYSYNNTLSGYYIMNSNNNTIYSSYAYNNSNYGFVVNNSHNNTLYKPYAYNNTQVGFFLNGSFKNHLDQALSYNNTHAGFVINGSSYNNTCSQCYAYATPFESTTFMAYGYYLNGSYNNTFANSYAYNFTTYGFAVDMASNNNTFLSCDVYNKTQAGTGSGVYGFYVNGSHNNSFTSNTVYNMTSGIVVQTVSDNNSLTSNTLYENADYGIYFVNSTNASVTSNTIYNNSLGIGLNTTSDNNTFTSNTVYNNTYYGFNVYNGSNNTFSSNTVYGSTVAGMLLNISGNNTARDNTVRNNTVYGVVLDNASNNTLSGNVIYDVHNNSDEESGYGLALLQAYQNTFTYDKVYNMTKHILVKNTTAASEVMPMNNFTNCVVGYSSTTGLVNYSFANVTNASMIQETNLILAAEFVSMDPTNNGTNQFNVSANVSLAVSSACGDSVYYATGFPTTRDSVVSGGSNYVTGYDACSAGVKKFQVLGWSGYTLYNVGSSTGGDTSSSSTSLTLESELVCPGSKLVVTALGGSTPLSNVRVFISGIGVVYTDADGEAEFDISASGTYQISATKSGYISETGESTVTMCTGEEGETTTVTPITPVTPPEDLSTGSTDEEPEEETSEEETEVTEEEQLPPVVEEEEVVAPPVQPPPSQQQDSQQPGQAGSTTETGAQTQSGGLGEMLGGIVLLLVVIAVVGGLWYYFGMKKGNGKK
ncbi:MAG: right-handed parallel beta-helix repeat-containing protein [Candidatus Micrarchaeota archaeon]